MGAAFAYLGVAGSVPLFHGSQGCTSFALVLFVRHFKETIPLQTTAMDEVATILGGADHLEEAILNLKKRTKPAFIGICTTALVETRGEDFVGELAAIKARRVDELEGTEIVLAQTPDFEGAIEEGWSKAVVAMIDGIAAHGQTTGRDDKGVGGLYVRLGLTLKSQIVGGRQERGRRAGTENVPGIVGFGRAAEIAGARLESDAEHMEALRDQLEQRLACEIPGLLVVGKAVRRLPNTSALACDGAEAEAIALMLSRAGVAVSTGAACAAGAFASSHVLRAMSIPMALKQGATRFSFSRNSRTEDVDRVVAAMPAIVARLRGRPSDEGEARSEPINASA